MAEKNDAMWDLYNGLRGKMNSHDFVNGLLLIVETAQELGSNRSVNANEVYEVMLRMADALKVRNPFPDRYSFIELYQMNIAKDDIDWEVIISMIDSRSSDIMHISLPLIQLFDEHFKPEVETVLVAEGEKFAPYLKMMIQKHPNCHYTITTRTESFHAILKMIFTDIDNVNIMMSSIYEYEFVTEKYDLIISVPNFGSRSLVDRDQHFTCREYDMVATENLLLHLNLEGELVIVLPARITFAAGDVKDLRDFIQQMYALKEISELPTGIFAGTGIKTYLFNIGTGKTEDIIIRKYTTSETVTGTGGRVPRKIEIVDETFVMPDELEEQGDWNLDKLFASQDEDWKRYIDTRKVPLGDVSEIFRGKAVNRKEVTGSIGVVNITNIKEYVIDYDGMDHIEESERKVANYVLEDGDVLIPARGTALKTAVFEKQDYTCIAHSNIIVIRPDPKELSGLYLKIFLDTPLGTKLLSSTQQGTSVMNISYKDLKNIEIPLPPLKKQISIAEEYTKELEMYLDSIQSAEERWNGVVERLQNMI